VDPILATLPERVATLERMVAELRDQARPTSPDWLDQLTGSVTDHETFEEILRLGREYRQSDRQPDDGRPVS
jgi:hypothetical protein